MPKKSKEKAEWEGDDEPQTGKYVFSVNVTPAFSLPHEYDNYFEIVTPVSLITILFYYLE